MNELEAKAIKKKLFNILEEDDLNRDVPDKVRKVMAIVESTAKEATMRERKKFRALRIAADELVNFSVWLCADVSLISQDDWDKFKEKEKVLGELTEAICQTEKEST